jgi:ubiquinone/menaquinone biosynthesis C-methylase UbiE
VPVMSAIESVFCRSSPWQAFARRQVLPWALHGQALAGEVLEIGAGSGAMADGVAAAFPAARLTVTDVDPAMVNAARKRLARQSNVRRIEIASVSDLPFPSASFDAVTSFLMLHHVVDWQDALVQVLRVLKPGATLVGYDLTDTPLARLVHWADRSPHLLISPRGLASGLAEAGFEDVAVHPCFRKHVMRFIASAPGPAA